MTVNADEVLLRRYMAEVYNAGNVTAVDELVSDDLRVEHPSVSATLRGRAGLTALIQELRRAFPDLRLQIEELRSEGARITARVTVYGVYPSAQTGIALFEVREGKITVDSAAEDLLGHLERHRRGSADRIARKARKARRRQAD
ncbi:MAG: ester cyclase [Dehalococcoidia bacterium]